MGRSQITQQSLVELSLIECWLEIDDQARWARIERIPEHRAQSKDNRPRHSVVGEDHLPELAGESPSLRIERSPHVAQTEALESGNEE